MQGAATADWGQNNKRCLRSSNTGGPHICRKLLDFRPTITFLLAARGEVAKIGLKYQAVTIVLCLPKSKFTSIQVHQQSTGKQSKKIKFIPCVNTNGNWPRLFLAKNYDQSHRQHPSQINNLKQLCIGDLEFLGPLGQSLKIKYIQF